MTKVNIGIYSKFGQYYRYYLTMYDFIHIISCFYTIALWAGFPKGWWKMWLFFSFLSGSRKSRKSFPLIGKVFAELGQNFAIFSKNQKQCQLLGVGLIAIYKSLPVECKFYLCIILVHNSCQNDRVSDKMDILIEK